MEQITYNMMFRWFVGLSMDAPVWDVTVFTKNRERLLRGDIARGFLAAILVDPQVKPLLSDEHFSVDGTLIEAWASMKAFVPRTGRASRQHPAATARSISAASPAAIRRMPRPRTPTRGSIRKQRARLPSSCHIGHALMENRNGLVVDTSLTKATGTAEREAAIAMIGDLPDDGRITLGTDKGYDTRDFVAEMRRLGVTPHVTQNTKGRRSAIDGRTTRHVGYAASLRIRKRIEEVFGWMKTVGGLRKTRHRGTARVSWMFTFVAARLQSGALTQAAG